MNKEEPGVTLLSLLKMLKRARRKRPVVIESTCGHCKTTYNVYVGHMCAYIKDLYSKLGES